VDILIPCITLAQYQCDYTHVYPTFIIPYVIFGSVIMVWCEMKHVGVMVLHVTNRGVSAKYHIFEI